MKRIRALAGLVVVFSAVGSGACSGGDDGQDTLGPPTGSTCPSDSALSYQSFGQAFIVTYCAECHDKKERPILLTQEDVQLNSVAIDRAAASGPNATNTYMPEDGSVPTSERQKLGEWLACGAP